MAPVFEIRGRHRLDHDSGRKEIMHAKISAPPPSTPSVFSVAAAPADPILSLQEGYDADLSAKKVNLGVGVYLDETGICPLFNAVRAAQDRIASHGRPKTYLPINGDPRFNACASELVFPRQVFDGLPVCVTQTLGGTGALRIAAELSAVATPRPRVWLPTPTWTNHNAIFQAAEVQTCSLPYLDASHQQLDTSRYLEALDALGPDDIVLLHGCCHNPTGVDPHEMTWRMVASIAKTRGWLPLIDLAYAGLGTGLDRDMLGIRTLVSADVPLLAAISFSKIFGLYGERTGALIAVTTSGPTVLSRLKQLIRRSYSNPPRHGAQIVATVLSNDELRIEWSLELLEARRRIQKMRSNLAASLQKRQPDVDFSHLTQQTGMFSMLPLPPHAVEELRQTWHIYLPKSGRINFAGLTDRHVDYVADALTAVMSAPSQRGL